jgi:hypothetical protein
MLRCELDIKKIASVGDMHSFSTVRGGLQHNHILNNGLEKLE